MPINKLHVGFYHLFDGFPAHGTVVSAGPERLHAPLTDTEVSAGEHHDTLLVVLADTAQLLLPLPLHLSQEILLEVPLASPLAGPLSQQEVVPPLGLPPLILLLVGVLHGSHQVLPVLLLVLAVSGVSKHRDSEVADGHLCQSDHHSQTPHDALEYEEVDAAEEPEGDAEDHGPGDVPLSDDPEEEVTEETDGEEAGDQPQHHVGGGGEESVVQPRHRQLEPLCGHLDQLDSGQAEEVESAGQEVAQQHQTAPHQAEQLTTLVGRHTDATEQEDDGVGDTLQEGEDTATASRQEAGQLVQEYVDTIED